MDKMKKAFASKLLKIKAIKLQPNDPFKTTRLHGHRDGNHHSIATTARLSRSPNCATT